MSRLWLLATIPFLAACEADRAEEPAEDAAATAPVEPLPPEGTLPGQDPAFGAGNQLTLNPVSGSPAEGATGQASFTPQGDQTEVTLTVNGAPANATLEAHVHRGTCDNDQGVAAPLNAVTVGADGSGTSTSTVSTQNLSGQHFVQVHGEGGAPILCAEAMEQAGGPGTTPTGT